MSGPWENYTAPAPEPEQEGPWKKYTNKLPSTGEVRSATGAFLGDMADRAEEMAGLVPGIDYSATQAEPVQDTSVRGRIKSILGGNPPGGILSPTPLRSVRFQLGRQSNTNETEAYLDKRFGPGNWAKAGSRYVIRPEAAQKLGLATKPAEGGGQQPVALNPFGPDMGDVAQFSGENLGPILGGAAAGALTGGLGFIPGVLGAGVGSAIGKGADEAIKGLEGTSRRSPEEIGRDITTEGVTGALGEGVFRLATPFLSRLLGPHTTRARSLFGDRAPLESTIDPERVALTQQALEEGYRPHISVATDKTLAGRMQSASEFIFGPQAREAPNREALMDARNNLAASVGSVARTPEQLVRSEGGFGSIWTVTRNGKRIQTFIPRRGDTNVTNGGPIVPVDPGQQVTQAGQTAADALNGAVQTTAKELADADLLVGKAQGELERKLLANFTHPDPRTGELVKDGINTYRRAFYNQAKAGYETYDTLVGGASVDVSNVKSIAGDWLGKGLVRTNEKGEQVPIQAGTEESVNFLKQLAGMDSQQTASALLSARSALKASLTDRGLPGVPDHVRTTLIKGIDSAMEQAEQIPGEASNLLRSLRANYREGMDKLGSYEVQRLSLDPSSASHLGADQVTDFISNLGSAEQVDRLKQVIPADTWRKVQRGVFDDMMQSVSSPNGVVDAKALAKELDKKSNILTSLYGPERANQIRVYSNFLSTRNGDIDLAGAVGDPYTILRNAAAKQQKMDTLLSGTADIKDVMKDGKANPVEIIPSLLRTNNVGKVEQLKRLVGEDSDAWQQIRAGAMEKILQPLVSSSDDAVKAVLNPTKFDESLRNFSPEVLTSLFGQQTTQDLYKFAQLSRFATAKPKSAFAGSIVAATIALHPLANLGMLAKMGAMSQLMAKPGFIKYMTAGMSEDAGARQALREATRMATQVAARFGSVVPEDVREE